MRIIGLLFFMIYIHTNAQNHKFINIDTLEAYLEKTIEKRDTVVFSTYSENWNNKVFNPYKNHTTEFPFKLSFTDSTYASPILKKNVVTSRFGWRWGRAHKGIDIDLITGDKVVALLDGKVRYVGYHSGHGRSIIIRHANGLETVYAHLSKYSVKPNDIVKKGQVIGKGGNTGNSRGSHIHIETIYKGNYINPEYLFSFDEKKEIKKNEFWVTKSWVTPYLHNSRRKSNLVYYDSKEAAEESDDFKSKIHVVKRGDTLYDISRRYNVSIYRICKTNSIRKNSTLKIGQQLVL